MNNKKGNIPLMQFLYSNSIMDRLQISLLILSEFKRADSVLFPHEIIRKPKVFFHPNKINHFVRVFFYSTSNSSKIYESLLVVFKFLNPVSSNPTKWPNILI